MCKSKYIVCLLLLCIMAISGCTAPENKVEPGASGNLNTGFPNTETGGKNILKENNVHMDEIVREGFSLPNKISEDKEAFSLPPFISDTCVLQANMAVRLWGRTNFSGGIAVRVTRESDGKSSIFYGEAVNGEFELFIEGPDAGGPYSIEFISETGSSCKINDVLFGEVFVLGGQSNMGWAMGQCYDGNINKMLYQDIIDGCADPELREMLVWPVNSDTPVDWLDDCRRWRSITPETIKEVSAVGYFFGRRMRQILGEGTPVGLVGACMGGTPISEWVIGGSWYNGQVNPIKRMTVRGVLWYQGEGDPVNYSGRLVELIKQWREEFDNPNLLWAAVQLPRYVNESSYYQCREEVKKVKELIDNYTYCVTIDTGLYPELKAEGDTLNDDGIHPYDKQPVGTRLADAFIDAFSDKEGLWTAPRAVSAEQYENGIKVTFENVGAGLMLDGLAGFELAGESGSFKDAVPELLSDTEIFVSCESVDSPVRVRYGYKNKSSLIEGDITSCSQSVCVYSTYAEGASNVPEYIEQKSGSPVKALPAEQFTLKIG